VDEVTVRTFALSLEVYGPDGMPNDLFLRHQNRSPFYFLENWTELFRKNGITRSDIVTVWLFTKPTPGFFPRFLVSRKEVSYEELIIQLDGE